MNPGASGKVRTSLHQEERWTGTSRKSSAILVSLRSLVTNRAFVFRSLFSSQSSIMGLAKSPLVKLGCRMGLHQCGHHLPGVFFGLPIQQVLRFTGIEVAILDIGWANELLTRFQMVFAA